MAQYARLAQSRSFPTQQKATEWAEEKSKDIKQSGVSVRKDVEFDETTNKWTAKIFVKGTGENSIEQPKKAT